MQALSSIFILPYHPKQSPFISYNLVHHTPKKSAIIIFGNNIVV